MTTESRAAGIAALLQAFCYIFGFAMLASVMNPGDTSAWSAQDKLEFVLERAVLFQLWNVVIYVVFGVALVVLAAALHRLLAGSGSLLLAVATPLGMIWAGLVIASGMLVSVALPAVARSFATDPDAATQLWLTIAVVQDGLGGGVEVVGGLWLLLLSVAAKQANPGLPAWLNLTGLLVGVAGILTIIPALAELGAVFGLGQILWFVGVGVVLLRRASSAAAGLAQPPTA